MLHNIVGSTFGSMKGEGGGDDAVIVVSGCCIVGDLAGGSPLHCIGTHLKGLLGIVKELDRPVLYIDNQCLDDLPLGVVRGYELDHLAGDTGSLYRLLEESEVDRSDRVGLDHHLPH